MGGPGLAAEAIKVGAEHFRRNRPRTMGSIFWQINDCWPVASWASIDYYGRWKALQYYARRFYNDVLVSAVRQSNGKIDVNVVSDRTAPVSGKIRTRLMNFSGKTLLDSTQAVTVAPLSSAAYVALDEQNLLVNADPHKVFLVVDFAGENGASSQNTLFFDHLKALDRFARA